MIDTMESKTIPTTERTLEVIRRNNLFALRVIENHYRGSHGVRIALSLDEAQELRDMLTRAIEVGESVRMMES